MCFPLLPQLGNGLRGWDEGSSEGWSGSRGRSVDGWWDEDDKIESRTETVEVLFL